MGISAQTTAILEFSSNHPRLLARMESSVSSAAKRIAAFSARSPLILILSSTVIVTAPPKLFQFALCISHRQIFTYTTVPGSVNTFAILAA